MVVGSGSEAGKILQKLSMIRKAKSIDEIKQTQEKVRGRIQADWLRNWRRVENIRRGGMVSMVKTASRNFGSAAIRMPLETLENVFDTTFLESLPEKEMYSGLAEIYKHSIITDLNLWNYLNENSNQLNYDYLVKTSSNLKLEIVKIDPYEKNIRKKLNFGHTVGHSIESYLLNINHPTLHGFAIAKGMIIESFIAKKENLLNEVSFNEIKTVLNEKFKAYLNFKIEPKAILKLMLSDKKNTKDSINFSLPSRIGEVTINHEIEFKKLESYLLEFFIDD
jgi:3-dehydroquinate synthetase